jgi:hypothetical protein
MHRNPEWYSQYPKTETQLRNEKQDEIKNKYCQTNNIKLIRLWESQIRNNKKEVRRLLCNLKKSQV